MYGMMFITLASALFCFNPPVDQLDLGGGGTLTLKIGEVPTPTERGKPIPVRIEISTSGKNEIRGTLKIDLEPAWSIEGSPLRSLAIPAGGATSAEFKLIPGKNTHPAHYPIHGRFRFSEGTTERLLHAVRIFETGFPPAPPADSPLKIGEIGRIPLSPVRAVRISWERFGEERKKMPFGWTGQDSDCRLVYRPGARADRGRSLNAIEVHPPWWNGAGTMFADYRIQLPKEGRLRFEAAGALRDLHPDEPPSDGVTYRISAVPAGPHAAEPPEDGEFQLLKEKHIAARRWELIEADLDPYAGRPIWLRLETHPGPKRDTTCDGAFWGAPCVLSGEVRSPLSFLKPTPEKAEEAHGISRDRAIQVPGGQIRAIWPGKTLTLVVENQPASLVQFHFAASADGEPEGTNRIRTKWEVRDPLIQASFSSDVRITDLSVRVSGVERVYAGFGNVIVQPKERATLGAGGEKLTTRHVGFDAGPWSLLIATGLPPDRLDVGLPDGASELHTHGEATFFIVPALRTGGEATAVWKAALAYRDSVAIPPGPGVKALAGRMVFDIWGGRYRDGARAIERAAALGLTGSVLVWHNWQRWGYDYRLPDIYPPNPQFGTKEEFQELAATCRRHDILFAPHDNYIDFYPDAERFNYDEICFDDSGRPVRAWFNRWREAQSYRFRPDRALPYVKRNLKVIAREVSPTAYFIDVFASIGAFDYRDSRGGFHPFTETVARWKEIFEHCRTVLGGAPQISEDGNDWMIGSVDGGQGNFQRVGFADPGSPNSWTTWRVRCEDAERIPWFDAVHHDRMVLHGAGYGSRYAGGQSEKEHGVDSGDYIATEVLAGHPPMASRIDSPGAIRKGWLLGGLSRALALKRIQAVEFAGGDIHRQRVVYQDSIEVLVNRGSSDWAVKGTGDGRVLPPFGFLARRNGSKNTEIAARERMGGAIVSRAIEPGARFVEVQGPEPVDLGWCLTRGAFRLETSAGESWDLLPLPGSGPALVKIFFKKISPDLQPREVRVLKLDGSRRVEGEALPAAITEAEISLTTRSEDAGYRIRFSK